MSMGVRPPDHPCLLDLGFHPLTLNEVWTLCVEPFTLSSTRQDLFNNLSEVVNFIIAEGIIGTLWVNGSFTTEKIDPEDVDLLLIIQGVYYDKGTESFGLAVNLLISNIKSAMKCDTYVAMEYPSEHPLYSQWMWDYPFYHKRWGWSREDETKGIVTLTFDGKTL